MLLIADSGSTKTAWALLTPTREVVGEYRTAGLNPSLHSDADIRRVLSEELRPQLQGVEISEVAFFGAGCRPEQIGRMAHLLMGSLGCSSVKVDSDLLGACIALCDDQPGICCILGTGSASCLYDGRTMVRQTPSLGYILGDEGSGASLGRRLISDVLKGQLPESLCRDFLAESSLTVASAIERVYRGSNVNRWLASHTTFLSRHLDDIAVQQLLQDEFSRFVQRNLLAYRRPDLPVNFVGSIAAVFREPLQRALVAHGLILGCVEREPLRLLCQSRSVFS